MDDLPSAAVDAMPEPVADWQPLPPRGAALAALSGALGLGLPLAAASAFITVSTRWLSPWLAVPLVLALAGGFGAWLGVRRHRRTRWKLDELGFAVRRGNWWQSETHVPISRVQHLDLKRGPLERSLRLSTLIVHTAGTRQATVTLSGLDAGDAERLRDRLAHQLDHDDAL